MLRYRHQMGFRLRVVRKAPILTNEQIRERLEWCLRHQNDDFENYVFGDETKIDINYFRNRHLRLKSSNPACLISNHRQRIKLNIWGCISYNGPSSFIVNFFYF